MSQKLPTFKQLVVTSVAIGAFLFGIGYVMLNSM